jgi:phosphatidylglycerol lysyltransferase
MVQKRYRLILTHMPRFVEERDEPRVEPASLAGRLLKKLSLVVYAIAVAWVALQLAEPYGSLGKPVAIPLTRGLFTVRDFKPNDNVPRAILLFGTGDGGWSGFEEEISKRLQKDGYEVVGIDFHVYAATDYDLATLQADIGKIAKTMREPYGIDAPPVILGGWSMGAAQAIAAAGGPNPPEGLVGLVLLDPCSRGRYGLTLADESNILPIGPGTFGVADFADKMRNLHVVQWHAALDEIDSRAWLKLLTAPHKEYDFEQTGHFYDNNRVDFLNQFSDTLPWILTRQGNVPAAGSIP